MILDLNIQLLKTVNNISLNQLVLLNLVLDKNQNKNQDIAKIVSLISDAEIQDLINRNLLTKEIRPKSIKYHPTKELKDILVPERDMFAEFKEIFPKAVTRPDGTLGHLHGNIKRCKTFYSKEIKNNENIHNHIIACLNAEIMDKLVTGKTAYMKTMWNWLTSREWENYEEQVKTPINEDRYGTNFL